MKWTIRYFDTTFLIGDLLLKLIWCDFCSVVTSFQMDYVIEVEAEVQASLKPTLRARLVSAYFACPNMVQSALRSGSM